MISLFLFLAEYMPFVFKLILINLFSKDDDIYRDNVTQSMKEVT